MLFAFGFKESMAGESSSGPSNMDPAVENSRLPCFLELRVLILSDTPKRF